MPIQSNKFDAKNDVYLDYNGQMVHEKFVKCIAM